MLRALALAALCASTGCVRQMLINGQIEGTREGSVAFEAFGDFEAGEMAAASAIVQFEGMRALSPENPDALFLLAKGYTGFAFAFVEDHMERAEDASDRELADHHRARARGLYAKAVGYGLERLAQIAPGFEDAKKSEATLKTWLEAEFTDAGLAPDLFWTGYAWISRANVSKDDAEIVAELFVGVELVRRSVALDPTYNAHSGQIILGGYHARTAAAELEEAQKMFEAALSGTGHKFLLAQHIYATTYHCAKADAAAYDKLLREVLAAEDPYPEQRLSNIVAKRRAARWLAPKRMFDACSMDPVAPPEAPATSNPS